MVNWGAFAADAPTLAAAGRRLLYGGGEGEAFLATVRDGEPPRIHPVNIGIVGEGLYAFVLDSAKRRDLERDGRFALHAHQDRAAPTEFMLRGHARAIEPGAAGRGRARNQRPLGRQVKSPMSRSMSRLSCHDPSAPRS
jgi:hypothetical protein